MATPLHTPQLCLVFKVVWDDPGDLWLVNPLVNPLVIGRKYCLPPYPKFILIGGTIFLKIWQRDCYVALVKDAQSERDGQEGGDGALFLAATQTRLLLCGLNFCQRVKPVNDGIEDPWLQRNPFGIMYIVRPKLVDGAKV
jgi:hypothetical protein